MKFYRKDPDPDLASLTERFEAAKKYETPPDRYMALVDVFADTYKALLDRTLGPLKSDTYYSNIMRTSGIGIIAGAVIGMIVAPHIMAGLAIGAVLGFGGGTFTEFARLEISGRLDKTKKKLEGLVDQINKSMDVKEDDLTLEQLQKSPLFGDFNKKYPDIIDSFRMAALRKEQDAAIAPAPEPKAPPGLAL
ncbi:MAG: hypothetical protein ACAH83_18085 [Alphaproteobacteria bacterium]